MIQHTPGPWTFAKYSKKRFGLGQSGDEAFFLIQCLCNDADSPQARADACLISAAPDLLDALKLAQLHINGGPGIQSGVEWWAMYDQIKEAIAKATGEAP